MPALALFGRRIVPTAIGCTFPQLIRRQARRYGSGQRTVACVLMRRISGRALGRMPRRLVPRRLGTLLIVFASGWLDRPLLWHGLPFRRRFSTRLLCHFHRSFTVREPLNEFFVSGFTAGWLRWSQVSRLPFASPVRGKGSSASDRASPPSISTLSSLNTNSNGCLRHRTLRLQDFAADPKHNYLGYQMKNDRHRQKNKISILLRQFLSNPLKLRAFLTYYAFP
jgi:hypothetical protein